MAARATGEAAVLQHRCRHIHRPDARRGGRPVAIYFDTSFLVPLFIPEPSSERAESFFADQPGPFWVSNLTAVEFASAMARRVRMRLFTRGEAQLGLSSFDAWVARSATHSETTAADFTAAGSFLTRLGLPLRTLDALHIAISQRLDAMLVTFDQRMIASARLLGIPVVTP